MFGACKHKHWNLPSRQHLPSSCSQWGTICTEHKGEGRMHTVQLERSTWPWATHSSRRQCPWRCLGAGQVCPAGAGCRTCCCRCLCSCSDLACSHCSTVPNASSAACSGVSLKAPSAEASGIGLCLLPFRQLRAVAAGYTCCMRASRLPSMPDAACCLDVGCASAAPAAPDCCVRARRRPCCCGGAMGFCAPACCCQCCMTLLALPHSSG